MLIKCDTEYLQEVKDTFRLSVMFAVCCAQWFMVAQVAAVYQLSAQDAKAVTIKEAGTEDQTAEEKATAQTVEEKAAHEFKALVAGAGDAAKEKKKKRRSGGTGIS
ncbi:hypothetical protein SARC_05148 [Sphaeroforma arctica JP610]|uniref:Uncharacterized protein n=1 Tax=Sphaeroforma arctica JP610 TaxID=667725 RepID=A0A0L0G186_9EUKA|nr:hypothetical protein SARC_05148 [Sphaeroforma arctica JP610]KNC82574.1 hypothetical protein SARC_05148 [Sphaeroforma arctica JP610]|eukprot:XP_014156476.1 hypothetical protein SARC_05148 [Sphaeroforma arctica JP610]